MLGVTCAFVTRGTITTLPTAVSRPARKLKTMLPLLPVSGLVYSPLHSPTSAVRSELGPITGTGVGREAQPASRVAAASVANIFEVFILVRRQGVNGCERHAGT